MALSYDQLSAITEKKFVPRLQDNIYGSNALLARLTRPQQKETFNGGTKIVCPIMSSKPGSAGRFFSDFETLDTSPSDNLSAAEFDIKQCFEPIKISRLQELKSNGDAAKIKLVAAKMQVAEKNFKENLALGLFSDGTAGTGALTTSQITGLRAIMSTTSTYGGIAVADLADWVAVVNSNSGTNRAVTMNLLQSTWGSCSYDDMVPTVMCANQNIYDTIWALFQPAQRLVSQDMKALGFDNLIMFNGVPILIDSHQEANSVYYINERVTKIFVHELEDMRYEKITQIETQAATLGRIFWAGNLTCSGRRFNGALKDLQTS